MQSMGFQFKNLSLMRLLIKFGLHPNKDMHQLNNKPQDQLLLCQELRPQEKDLLLPEKG